jgi:flagellar biosynthesis protein FlhA
MEIYMKKNDMIVGMFLLSAIVFLIIPMPSFVLDIMLALNISIAMVVLFNAMFTKEVLNMSAFPTILLFTTMFRISLNVSSTKLVLLTGEPGNVITTFGKFVGGGNLIVVLLSLSY